MEASLGAALAAATARHAARVCLIESDRGRDRERITYAEFDARARRLAAGLGLREGDRVAILMTNQSKWLITAYAVFLAGGVLVPLDWKLDAESQIALLRHSRARVLVVEHSIRRRLRDTGLPGITLVTEAPEGEPCRRWEECAAEGGAFPVARREGDDACIVYSSGTGGEPKGCVLTHGAYLAQFRGLMSLFPFRPGDRYLSILPTNHAIDFMAGFIGPFLCGATVVHLRALRPEHVRDAFTRYGVTYVSVVPLVLEGLRAEMQRRFDLLPSRRRRLFDRLVAWNRRLTRKRPRRALSRLLLRPVHRAFGGRLHTIFVGGAFSEPSTLRFFYDLGLPVANGYGLTEAGTAVALNDLRPFRDDTVGKPLPGVRIQVRDPDEHGVGEVWVSGPTLMDRYLDAPETTAEAIREGWLRTGDLGRFEPDGHLMLFGRAKNMIVTAGGKNVYPEDVESAFAGIGVESCVFAAHYVWPERREEALVLAVRGGIGDLDAIRERNRRLPDFKRVRGVLAWEEEFPRTASLKLKRQDLARRIGERASPDAVVPL